MGAEEERIIITDIKRLLREMEDFREKLRMIDRKIDEISNRMTEKQMSKRIIG